MPNLTDIQANTAKNGPVVHLQEVCKRFKEVIAVDHLSLQIGTFLACGPNGAGGNVIEMIEGLQRPIQEKLRTWEKMVRQ
jgi:ABC-type branched-subunit amino acid transport system ATPase component